MLLFINSLLIFIGLLSLFLSLSSIFLGLLQIIVVIVVALLIVFATGVLLMSRYKDCLLWFCGGLVVVGFLMYTVSVTIQRVLLKMNSGVPQTACRIASYGFMLCFFAVPTFSHKQKNFVGTLFMQRWGILLSV